MADLKEGKGLRFRSQGFLLRILVLVGMVSAAATAQVTWTTVAASGTTNELRAIVYGNGEFVAVGDVGTILTSTNGTTWTARTSGTTKELFGITWGNNLFIAVGDSGTLLTSTNGTSWTAVVTNLPYPLHAALWADNMYVVVGDNGTILTSPTGVTWTTQVSGCFCDFLGIAYGGQPATFVVVGGFTGPIMTTSPNGTTWTAITAPGTQVLNQVVWSGTSFAAVGDSGVIYTSPGGTAWTRQVSGDSAFLSDVIWAANQFVIVGHEGAGTFGPILSSPTGITWTERTSSSTQWLYGIAWGNNLFIAVGTDGIITTSSGVTAVVNSAAPALKQGAVRISGNQVNYALAAEGHVSMKLFDMRGRLVDVLLDRQQAAGAYSQSLRPAGMNLPFGKYVLSVKTGQSAIEEPVVLGQ